ncbi:DUF4190 domain-containing protein [Lysobacter korlensis]|uniref:DUF4190 domain-containing protein n=1 Tax=Lysobacter korlensis TaxID=553636 RepID=A0ABV6RKY1_9GAMM
MNEPVRSTSSLAIASLVSGILGWTVLPLIGSIVAIVTGHLARSELRREGDRLTGDGMAVAGLVLGYLALATLVIGILMVLVFFGGVAWLSSWQQ